MGTLRSTTTDPTGHTYNGWTCTAKLYIRRVGNSVQIGSDGSMNGTAKTNDIYYTVPTGFRTSFDTYLSSGSLIHICASGANLQSSSATSGQRINFIWNTTDAWPTSLPGTASGSIPNA